MGTSAARSADSDTAMPAARASSRGPLASLSLAMLLSSLGTSSANVGLPAIAQAFAAPFQAVQWIVLAYLVATTSLIVSVGRLGDILGRRRLMLTGLSLFATASLLCGIAPTLGLLIAARAAQGLGAAIMMALAMAMVGGIVPQSKTGSAMGLLGTMSAIGTALGPSLGGMLIAASGWRWIFLVNLPIALVAAVLARRSLPDDRADAQTGNRAFDRIGTLLLVLTLGAYALAMTTGHGQIGPLNAMLLLGAGVGGALFVHVEKKIAAPLIRLDLFRDRVLRSALATNAIVATVMMMTLVVGPFHLARALGLDAAAIGLVMSAGPLAAALAGVPAGHLVDRHGARRMALAGLIGMASACLALSLIPATAGIAGYVAPMVVVTIGYAVFQAANTTAVMSGVDAGQRGLISGLLNMSRNLGLVSGASLMGAVFALAAGTGDLAAALAPAVDQGTKTAFAVATGLIVVAIAIARGARKGRHDPAPIPA